MMMTSTSGITATTRTTTTTSLTVAHAAETTNSAVVPAPVVLDWDRIKSGAPEAWQTFVAAIQHGRAPATTNLTLTHELVAAAKNGNPAALTQLAGAIKAQRKKIMQMLFTIAGYSNSASMCTIGDIYASGDADMGKNDIEAVKWYERAAQVDDNNMTSVDKLRDIALAHSRQSSSDDFIQHPTDPALLALIRISTNGSLPRIQACATVVLGNIYKSRKMTQEALAKYRQVVTAGASAAAIAAAMYQLGNSYRSGAKDLDQNEEEAAKWLELAAINATKDCTYAIEELTSMAISGSAVAYAKLTNIAQNSTLSKQTNVKAEAINAMGQVCNARHMPQEALVLFEQAAHEGSSDAMFHLGNRCKDGWRKIDSTWVKRAEPNEAALAWYRQADGAGSATARNTLGTCYENGHLGVKKDPIAATRHYLSAAEKGDSHACSNIGITYMSGLGFCKNPTLGLKWLRRAAELNERAGMFNLARTYYQCDPNKDLVQAKDLYTKAAKQQFVKAMLALALMSEYSSTVNEQEAFRWYRQAADAGDGKAMTQTALATEVGSGGLDRDNEEALRQYRQAAINSPEGMYNMGLLYQYGDCSLEKDEPEAMKCFRLAAGAGSAVAMEHLGGIFESGKCDQLPNGAIALEWYQKAADAGDARAMKKMGDVFYYGMFGQVQDDEKAALWYRKATKNKSIEARQQLEKMVADDKNAAAAFTLGQAYKHGWTLLIDMELAVNFYRQSADVNDSDTPRYSGNVDGMYHYAYACEHGECVKKDLEQALTWYQRAADEHSPYHRPHAVSVDAIVMLGDIFYYGKCSQQKNLALAVQHYKRAAALQNISAIRQLANICVTKTGLPIEERKQLIPYIKQAADGGDTEAMTDWGLLLSGQEINGIAIAARKEEIMPTDEDWLEKAALAGNPRAMYYMVVKLFQEKKYDELYMWLTRSADAGHPQAIYRMAEALSRTNFHQQPNEAKAVELFWQAGGTCNNYLLEDFAANARGEKIFVLAFIVAAVATDVKFLPKLLAVAGEQNIASLVALLSATADSATLSASTPAPASAEASAGATATTTTTAIVAAPAAAAHATADPATLDAAPPTTSTTSLAANVAAQRAALQRPNGGEAVAAVTDSAACH